MTSLQQKQETICINLQWVGKNQKKYKFGGEGRSMPLWNEFNYVTESRI